MNLPINIDTYTISSTSPVFIIAELSANHLQDINLAKKTIKAAAESHANAIKLQTYLPHTMTIKSNQPDFILQQGTIWDGKKLYDLYKSAYTPWEWHAELQQYAQSLGLIFFSSPFDTSSVDFLETLNVPAYKIASFEISDIPLIDYVASKGKPIIISTGLASTSDIQRAIDTCKRQNNTQLIFLKCTSLYPAPYDTANIKTMVDIAQKHNVYAGLSDHSPGFDVPMVATALGARVIEKHIILDKNLNSPDASFSLDPAEFKLMVEKVRLTESICGSVTYELSEKATKSKELMRSLYITEDVKKGDRLNPKNCRAIRPGFGMHPKHYINVLGKLFNADFKKGTRLSWDLLT